MKDSLLIFLPKGDTELVLRRPNFRKFAKSKDEENSEENATVNENDNESVTTTAPIEEFQDRTSSISTTQDLRELRPSDEDNRPNEVRFRVSSAHLILASPVFKAMLDGPFSEGVRNKNGLFEIKAFEWNTIAMVVLMDIIHGHHRSVHPKVTLGLFTEIAMVVDYYQCHEIAETFAAKWVAAWGNEFLTGYDDTTMPRLFIGWVFGQRDLFDAMVFDILNHSTTPLKTDLPLPSTVLERLESRRVFLISRTLENLYGLLESLWATDDGCIMECSSMHLGLLMKAMRQYGFEVPKPKEIKTGKSFDEIHKFLQGLTTPTWYVKNKFGTIYTHDCSFKEKMKPWLNDLSKNLAQGAWWLDFQKPKSADSDAADTKGN
ncbi:hypothetical protein FHETE_8726 [Fusarium heterosporum]|uniref:BTB domain-containing protein n=1 Tax=Fusarium heterosporum TaxID=42747 RepID=A0A8H5WJI6_FUSHE|nr:hypothetical protein FHETE_8726 [Fusarium heterosporum]